MQKMLRKIARSLLGQHVPPQASGEVSNPVAERRIWPLPTGDSAAWIANARPIDTFMCDAVFMLPSQFYMSPSNGLVSHAREAAQMVIPPIDLKRQTTDYVTTAEAFGHEDALIAHYSRIVELASRHGQISCSRAFPYFSTKPALIEGGRLLTEFDYNDSIYHTRSVLNIFIEAGKASPQLMHDDSDQGWHVLIAATDATTTLIEWEEGPFPPPSGGYAFNADELALQATAALTRLETIHHRLVSALGVDYWAR